MATQIQGVIVAARRRNSSVNGNPRFDITVRVSQSGEYQMLLTSSDASCAYSVENVQRSGEEVLLGLTRAGRVETITRLVESPMGA